MAAEQKENKSDSPPNPAANEPTGRVCTTCEVVLRIGMFYDGTNNNQYNTAIREATNTPVKEKHPITAQPIDITTRANASYGNDYTDIVKLHRNYPATDTAKVVNGEQYIYGNFYVDGVGTVAAQDDRYFLGTGGDYGPTGAVAKAKIGSDRAYGFAKKYVNLRKVVRIELDIFGYSRGATSARHFANMVKTLTGLYHWGYGAETDKIKQVNDHGKRYIVLKASTKIIFIGLFDTVSTHGVEKTTVGIPAKTYLPPDIADKKVFQIVAKDEMRGNFSLISVLNDPPKVMPRSPLIKEEGKFKEQYSYGAHADSAGGYPPGAPERSVLAQGTGNGLDALQAIKARDPVPGSISVEKTPGGTGARRGYVPPGYKIVSQRPAVRGDLPKVSLKLMTDEAQKQGVPLKDVNGDDQELPPDLKDVPAKLNNKEPLSPAEVEAIKGGTHHSAKLFESTDDFGLEPTDNFERVIHPNNENK